MRNLNELLDDRMARADHDYYDHEYVSLDRSDSTASDNVRFTINKVEDHKVRTASWVDTYEKFLNQLF